MAKNLSTLPLAAAFAILCATLLPVPAAMPLHNTLQCMPREIILDSLAAAHGEVPAHAGVASNGALLEVTVNPDGGWTAFFTFPDGLACPVADGEGWRDAPAIDDDPAA